MIGSIGLPVGVQVVAPWYEDEMCLRVMKEVEGAADIPCHEQIKDDKTKIKD